MKRLLPVVLTLAGCGSPLDESGWDDPLPPPPTPLPTLLAVAEPAVTSAAPARAEIVSPARPVIGPPTSPPPSRGDERPAVIPPAVRRAAEPDPPPVEAAEIEDHYHRDFSVPGDHVLFQLAAGASQIWLFPDRATFDGYFAAIRRGDRKTVESIQSKGALRFVPVNTKGTILKTEKGIRQVKVDGGSLTGISGWIDEDHLRAEPPPVAAMKAKQERAREVLRQKDVQAGKDANKMETMLRVFGPGSLPMPNPQTPPSKKRKGTP